LVAYHAYLLVTALEYGFLYSMILLTRSMVRTVPVVSDDWGAEFTLMPSFTAGVHAWIIAAIVTVVLIYSAIVSSSIGLCYTALDYRISYLIIACHT
jgi:hypothetical protein